MRLRACVSAGNPHGRLYYSCDLLLATAGGLCFAWGALAPDAAPPWLRLLRAGIAFIFLFGAAQASERLWRPQAAIERSRGLSDRARRLIGLSRAVARGAGLGGILLTTVVARDSRGDLLIASLTLVILGHCLGDIAAETGRAQAQQQRV